MCDVYQAWSDPVGSGLILSDLISRSSSSSSSFLVHTQYSLERTDIDASLPNLGVCMLKNNTRQKSMTKYLSWSGRVVLRTSCMYPIPRPCPHPHPHPHSILYPISSWPALRAYPFFRLSFFLSVFRLYQSHKLRNRTADPELS